MKLHLLSLLLLCAVFAFGKSTLDIDFAKPVNPVINGKELALPNTHGSLALGSQSIEFPAATLVGESGTILIKVKQEKPTAGLQQNRAAFTLRCNSRMTATLYMTIGSFDVFRFGFGDRNEQIYYEAQKPYQFGKEQWMGITWDGKTVQFITDGKVEVSYKQPIKMEKVRSLYVGAWQDGWNSLKQWPDDTFVSALKVFDNALSPAEIAAACGTKLQPSHVKYPGKMTVPVLLGQQVAVDGDLKEALWNTAASLPVLASYMQEQTYLAPEGRFLMSADQDNLYLGLNYIFPAGNNVVQGQVRKPGVEPEVWGTESFELYFLIGEDWYRFGGNVAGGYTESKNNGSEWNAPWKYASQLRMQIDNTNLWQAEAAIPWNTLGLKSIPDKPIKFAFCRTWRLPDYSDATSIIHDSSYQNKELYLDLCFSKNAATVRKLAGNEPSRGALYQKVSVSTPVAGKLSYEIAAIDASGASEPMSVVRKEQQFKAGETVEFELTGRIASKNYDQLMFTLYQGKDVVARNIAPYKLNEVLLDVFPRFIAGNIEVEAPSELLYSRYGANAGLQFKLFSPEGKVLQSVPLKGDKAVLPFDNKGTAGLYKVGICKNDGTVISELELHFPGMGAWSEADKLFPQNVILPPFTPLMRHGNAFEMWGRKYEYGKALFPEKVISQGKDMLLGAPEVICNGKTVASNGIKVGQVAAHRAEFSATASNDDCTISEEGWVEYDGVSYSKFNVTASKNVKDLKLRFTLPRDVARYMHAVVGGSWGAKITRPVTDGEYAIGFYPILWMGQEDKGICFFTETDKGWTFPKGRAIVINCDKDKATIEFNVRSSMKAGEKFTFEMGYLATPVKSFPSHFPMNSMADPHCAPMQRPNSDTFIGYHVICSTPYPHEIEDFFANLPDEEHSNTPQYLNKQFELCRKFRKQVAVYMDGRMLTDEYPEMAAFRDEWRCLPQKTLDYKKDGKLHIIYDTCPTTGANAFFCLQLKRLIERFKPEGIYYDFGTVGVCSNKLHGCDQRWPFLAYREFLRRTYYLLWQNGVREPVVCLHNTDYVQIPAITFATHLLNGEHIRQSSSTIMHNGKDIQDTYDIEMFANELSSMPFGLTNSVYQANDVLLPKYGGGKEDPELYKFRITQAFLAGVLPHNTMLDQGRCHYGILEKVSRAYDDFGIRKSQFIGYWDKPAKVESDKSIYVSVYVNKAKKKALAVVSHIGKDHDVHNFNLTFDEKVLGFKPSKALDVMPADDPLYQELYELRKKYRVPNDRAPLKLGDWGSKINSFANGKLNMSLKYHTFAIIELQ